MFKRISLLVFILIRLSIGQDEFTFRGVYNPFWFPEMLDAEVYRSDLIYFVGVGGFIFVDVHNPEKPKLFSRYNLEGIFTKFYNGKAEGDLAIAAARLDGLYLIDISNISQPSLYGIHSQPDFSYESAEFMGNFAYAAVHQDGIEILDISDPVNPSTIRLLGDLENAWDVFIVDSLLYVADGVAGLRIYSLLQPENPRLLSAVSTTGLAREVMAKNQKAYIALGSKGFDIFDVSDPENPQFISNYQSGFGIVHHLDVENEVVFTATWEMVEAVDISDPFHPKLIATEDTPTRAMGLAVLNRTVYVTDWNAFLIYSFENFEEPDIHVKPVVFDFGYRGDNVSISQDFKVYNLGETELTVSSIEVNSDEITITPQSLSVAAGNFQTVNLTYTPSTQADFYEKLKFHSNDPDEAVKNIQLLGGTSRLAPGDTAPDFSLLDLEGTLHTLSDYRGRTVILAFFASW